MLGRDEDFFVETDAEGGFAGLKETARRLIRDLPPEGRRAYEVGVRTGGRAAAPRGRGRGRRGGSSKLSPSATSTRRPGTRRRCCWRRTKPTPVGTWRRRCSTSSCSTRPAAVRLHDPELSIRAAASWLAADEPDASAGACSRRSRRAGRRTIEIAGREHSLDASAEPLEWLRATVGEPADAAAAPERQWLTYRGNAARNGEAGGGLPHMRVRWKVRLLQPVSASSRSCSRSIAADLVQVGPARRRWPAPRWRRATTCSCARRSGCWRVDFRTGKRVWRSEPQRDSADRAARAVRRRAEEEAANAEPARSFARRMWEDYLYGVMSSDGDRVYVIRDLPMPAAQDYEMAPFMGIHGAETSGADQPAVGLRPGDARGRWCGRSTAPRRRAI